MDAGNSRTQRQKVHSDTTPSADSAPKLGNLVVGWQLFECKICEMRIKSFQTVYLKSFSLNDTVSFISFVCSFFSLGFSPSMEEDTLSFFFIFELRRNVKDI